MGNVAFPRESSSNHPRIILASILESSLNHPRNHPRIILAVILESSSQSRVILAIILESSLNHSRAPGPGAPVPFGFSMGPAKGHGVNNAFLDGVL